MAKKCKKDKPLTFIEESRSTNDLLIMPRKKLKGTEKRFDNLILFILGVVGNGDV